VDAYALRCNVSIPFSLYPYLVTGSGYYCSEKTTPVLLGLLSPSSVNLPTTLQDSPATDGKPDCVMLITSSQTGKRPMMALCSTKDRITLLHVESEISRSVFQDACTVRATVNPIQVVKKPGGRRCRGVHALDRLQPVRDRWARSPSAVIR